MIKELDYPSYSSGGFQRISWGAVFAGTFVSLAILVLLTSLGAGIGLTAAPSAVGAGTDALRGYGIGGAVYMLVTGIVSFYAGGWIAGRLNGIPRVSESVIHGIVTWAVATVLLAFVFTTAGFGALGAAANAMGSTGLRPGGADTPVTAPAADTGDAANAARAVGVAGLFGFVMLLCDAAACGYGARSGTRVLRPIAMSERETHRERERVI